MNPGANVLGFLFLKPNTCIYSTQHLHSPIHHSHSTKDKNPKYKTLIMAKGWKDNVNTFDNVDRVKLLGVIDHLRELGISDDIPLPQVCNCSALLCISC